MRCFLLACCTLACRTILAAEPVTLETVVDPGANLADEPVAETYSEETAIRFLDSAALHWQKQRECFTCHTNYAYLYARPLVSSDCDEHKTVRAFAEQLVSQRWSDKGPRWDAEVVATAAALAFNDAHTTNTLHPVTREALDKMWSLQREDGGWTWIDCDWPPMEDDDGYGVCLAALAVGVAPDDYRESEAARKGLDGIRRFFAANPPPTLHHRAMLLWADSYGADVLTDDEVQQVVAEIRLLQHADGGWSLAQFGNWEREDGSPQDLETSNGYGTGFAVYILRKSGVPADDPSIQQGVTWLKGNQRTSGRWFTRSVYKDSKHYISHIGTAFAVMAIAECE
ncbi:MAG: squalene--hopene cyclase [Planctomycetaceae bacterium]|nr:squalene--hopene cyclase [Planctomycetaceae bacterium]